MAFGDYDGPDKPNKGQENGACNRQRCQSEPAIWYNHGSYSWYCEDCKKSIGDDPVVRRGWDLDFYPMYGHPMFETREMMTERQNKLIQDMGEDSAVITNEILEVDFPVEVVTRQQRRKMERDFRKSLRKGVRP